MKPGLSPNPAPPTNLHLYPLSHLRNDHDVSAYSRGRRLLSRVQLVCFLTRSKRNTGIDTYRMRLAACILERAQWRQSRSRDDTKYRKDCILTNLKTEIASPTLLASNLPSAAASANAMLGFSSNAGSASCLSLRFFSVL